MLDAGSIQYTVEIETAKTLKAQDQLDGGFNKLQSGMDKTDRAASSLNRGMSKLALSIAAVISASALKSMADLVQGYQEMAERVKMATSSQEEYEMVQKRLLDTANGTYRSLAEAQELYIRTADSLRSMGYSTQQAIDVTDAMSYAFVTNATSADRAAGATAAFSKSMVKGKVDAEAWSTITTALPTIINAVADASGKSAEEIRKLGAEGKLSARDLSEGLRGALEETKKSAEGMAVTLKDAATRSTTALTAILVSLEDNTGALQTFTNAIVQAADMVLDFAGDSEKMASALNVAGTAATALATVIAAKLVGSMAQSALEFAKSAAAMIQHTLSAKANAAAQLQLAQAEAVAAANALMQAQAAAKASVGISTHAAAVSALAVAEARATAATASLTAATRAFAGAASVATVAANGLRTAMAFLGGPVGIALLAATAIYQFATSAKEAKPETDKLTGSINTLSTAAERAEQRFANLTQGLDKLNKAQLSARRGDLEKQLGNAERQLKSFQRQFDKGVGSLGQIEGAKAAITELKKALEGLDARAGAQDGGDAGTESGQKRIKAMQDELALLKVTGEKRAELAALQRLGDEATDAEKQRVKELAIEIYNLEEAQRKTKGSREKLTDAQKEAKKAAEDEKRGIEQNADVLADLKEAIDQATMSTDELIKRKAVLRLSQQYATPEEIAEVQRLALELDKLEKIKARKEKITGADGGVEGYVDGNVDPLSGGQFDNQTARYDAEAKKEQERYAAQHERLLEAKELELITEADYQLRLEDQYQTHAERMAQIEQAKNQLMIDSGQQLFDALASATGEFAGKQSGIYKAMFAASKAFAIADATVKIQQGLANAAAMPFPANLAAMGSVAAATGSILSSISSVAMAGKALGGPVQPNQMYRVNENGPEIFNAANGRQYMMPNQRGEVVSNKDATAQMSSSGSNTTSNTMNLTINMQGGGNGNYTATQIANKTAQKQRIQQARLGA